MNRTFQAVRTHPLLVVAMLLTVLVFLSKLARAEVHIISGPQQDANSTAPARPADYTVDSGWITPNHWDIEDPNSAATHSENDATAAIRVRIPQPGTVGIVYRQRLEYRYNGTIFVSALAPAPIGFSAASWNAFFLAHSPNGINGPGANTPTTPFLESPFNGLTAGGSSLSVIVPNDGQVHLVDHLVTYAEQGDGGYMPIGAYTFQQSPASFARWSEVDGLDRAGQPYHELWLTPAEDNAWDWTWMAQVPRADYSHSVSYNVQLLERVTLEVWELQPGEAHP